MLFLCYFYFILTTHGICFREECNVVALNSSVSRYMYIVSALPRIESLTFYPATLVATPNKNKNKNLLKSTHYS